MEPTPDLENAYALTSADEVKALYREWSDSYDTGFSDAQGYQLPREVAVAFAAAGGAGPVLDVGAGTGLVGAVLQRIGAGSIDGIDLSNEMLQVAHDKGCYRGLFAGDVTKPLTLQGAPYAGVVSAGTFTLGHVGPEALQNLLDVAAPGACFVISVNAAHFASAGFENAFTGFRPQITDLRSQDVRIYDDRADAGHRNDMARLMIFRKG